MRKTRIHLGDDVRDIDFPIGSFVFLKVAEERRRGLVVGYQICPDDILYIVGWSGGSDSRHYPIELTSKFQPDYVNDAAEEECE
jgi:hypothetical protein